MKAILPLVLATSALVAPAPAPEPPIPFERVAIYLEYNATDNDAEVVIDLKADADLERLIVLGPQGQAVLKLRSKDTQALGLNEIVIETNEPGLAEVLASYPAGVYRFFGRTLTGEHLFSAATLSHDLPPAPVFIHPLDGATAVPLDGAATWAGSSSAVSWLLELEQEDVEIDLLTNLKGQTTSFGFPAGWLEPGLEHQLGLAARASNGNITVTEIHFTAED